MSLGNGGYILHQDPYIAITRMVIGHVLPNVANWALDSSTILTTLFLQINSQWVCLV